MTKARDLARLQDLSRLLLDQRLSVLREVAARRALSERQLSELNLAPAPTGLGPVTSGQVAFRYQIWADARRAELNALLARQTAEWLSARDDAKLAFGRAEALQAVARRVNRPT
jgi:hypothetical protein